MFATHYIRVSLKIIFLAHHAKLFLAHLYPPLPFIHVEPALSLSHASEIVGHHTLFLLLLRYSRLVVSLDIVVAVICLLNLLSAILLSLHFHPLLFLLFRAPSVAFTNLFISYLKLLIISIMF